MTTRFQRIAIFVGAALLGGVGGVARFAFADLPWMTFFEGLPGVAAFAALGTALRISVQDFAVAQHRHLRVGMFAANLIGTAAIAFAMERPHSWISGSAFTAGFCGGLTTFSGFVAESILLVQHHHWRRAFLFMVATFGLSLIAFVFLHSSTPTTFPWRTLTVNLSGCFLFGIIDKAVDPSANRSALHRMLLSGFLGGYTTLSSLVAETCAYGLASPFGAAANVIVQLIGGGLLLIGGRAIGSRIAPNASRKKIAPSVQDVGAI